MINIFGDTLSESGTSIDFAYVEKAIKFPVIKPRYRVSVLFPDETTNYVIPDIDIPENGINYTEEYQNGLRRNISLTLINVDGKYTPSINGIWLSTKFKFEIGLQIKSDIVWFPRGIYVLGDMSLNYKDSDKTITLQLKDKYAMYEGKTGTLEEPYEIELGSDIREVVKGITNFSTGSGYIIDYKEVYLDPSFIDFKTQATIRVEAGGNLGEVINQLATQLSAEYYYNNLGNLCFYPINETVDDSTKPIIWTFEGINRELHNLSLNYKNEEVINVVKVVGDNITSGINYAIATNSNPSSPICIEQIGRRCGDIINDSNIWSNDLAVDLANYYLRKSSFIGVEFSCEVAFNPILTVNNICEVENSFLGLAREKLLLTSISYSSQDGLMSVKFCNTKDLPFI